jgi:hypothetical protein
MSTIQEQREDWLKSVIGHSLEEVTDAVERSGGRIRVMERDGQHGVGTCDFDMDRVNVAVYDGLVTKAHFG